MASPNESTRDYFIRRAREERVMAVECNDDSAALAHLRMAEEYESRLNFPKEVMVAD